MIIDQSHNVVSISSVMKITRDSLLFKMGNIQHSLHYANIMTTNSNIY